MSPEKSLQIFHELQVHQIELELQNEELRRAQVELADARTRYIDLYDLAPVGYLTISAQGKILEANRAATTLLGTARSTLAGQPISQYILNEYQDVYYFFQKQLFESGKPQVCELRMATNGIAFWAHLHASTATNVDGTTECRLVLIDITELKQAEKLIRQQVEQLHDSNEDLMIFNDAAVDRELRMIELKGEINELCKQTGQPPRYTLDFRMGGGESDGQ